MGDGLMVSFVAIPNAIRCAIGIQKAFAAYNLANPETSMYLRIGLSAARTCAHAKPGQILVAQIVRDQYQGDKSLFSDVGAITPKGFDHPVQIYAVKWQEA